MIFKFPFSIKYLNDRYKLYIMDLNYKVEGSGEALVFIHGLSDSLLYWEFLAANLKDDYQIIRMDLRGHGESELGNDEITIDAYVGDLKNLLDELKITHANLIGFSLGGAVAIDFTIKYPDIVDSLVLMSSFYKVDQYSIDILNQFRNALDNSFEDFYDLILPMVLCPDVIEENKDELMFLRRVASQTANTQAYSSAVDVCSNLNLENELGKIDIPALVLAGRYDEISLLETQKELHDSIDNSDLIVFDDVKHNLLIGKNNERILDILKNFFKK